MAIYFLKEDKSGLVKVGVATDVKRRIKDLQTGNPRKIYLVESFSTRGKDFQCESEIHRFLLDYSFRDNSEWFILTSNNTHHISEIILKYNPNTNKDKLKRFRKKVVTGGRFFWWYWIFYLIIKRCNKKVTLRMKRNV